VPGKSDVDFINSNGGIVKRRYKIINAISADVPEESIDTIAKSPNVEYVENDEKVFAHIPIGTCQEMQILKQTVPWGINRIRSRIVNAAGNTGKGIKVGILDTGIDYNHEDLKGNYKGGYNFVDNNNDPMDDNGHGGHVAGTVAAEDNDIGVVGVAPQAYLYSVKVLAFDSTGVTSDIVSGLEWSVYNNMQVINMSLGSEDDSISVGRAIENTYNAGVLIVAAAGNDGNAIGRGDNIDYPSRYSSVVSVGATNINDKRASFSSTGPSLELSAPGVDILSTLNGGINKYGTLSGTSMASPHVTGVAVLIMANEPGITNARVRIRMQTTSENISNVTGGFSAKELYGYGLIDAVKSVSL
jgi:subtilisin family serine protease